MKKSKIKKNKPKKTKRIIFSLQFKLIFLLGAFLIISSLVFYSFFKSYLIQDRVLNIKEFQLLHTANSTRTFADELVKIKNEFTINAVKLVDPSRGSVDLNNKHWLWVRAGDFTWKSDAFNGKIPPPPTHLDKWKITQRNKALYIQNKIPILKDGVAEEVFIDGAVNPSVLDPLKNVIEQGAIQGVMINLSRGLKDLKKDILISHDDSGSNFSQIFNSLDAETKKDFTKFTRPMSSQIQVLNTTYYLSWSPVPINKSSANFGFVSFISEEIILSKFKKFIVEIAFYSILLLGFGLISAALLSKHISKPVEKLNKATSILQKGDFSARVKINQSDEIGALGTAFNNMGAALEEREKALQDAQSALIQSEKMSAIGTMSAGLAHEVKNPLAGILGNAELAGNTANKLPDEHKQKLNRYLGIIQKETLRCKSIIEGLMRFSRAEKLELKNADLEVVCLEVISLMEHNLRKNNVQLNTEFDPKLWQILGSENHLEQVILNMIQNASQAMPDGGQIMVKTEYLSSENAKHGKYLAYVHPEFKAPFSRVLIADNGSGMDAEYQKKIFEPFITSKERGKGTGLGLAVTMGILSDHKARVSITSAPGKGTAFYLDFSAHSERDEAVVNKIRSIKTNELPPPPPAPKEQSPAELPSDEFGQVDENETNVEALAGEFDKEDTQSSQTKIDSSERTQDTLSGFSVRKPGKK